jgi:hypothetical protein
LRKPRGVFHFGIDLLHGVLYQACVFGSRRRLASHFGKSAPLHFRLVGGVGKLEKNSRRLGASGDWTEWGYGFFIGIATARPEKKGGRQRLATNDRPALCKAKSYTLARVTARCHKKNDCSPSVSDRILTDTSLRFGFRGIDAGVMCGTRIVAAEAPAGPVRGLSLLSTRRGCRIARVTGRWLSVP